MFTNEEITVAGVDAGDASGSTPEVRGLVDRIVYEKHATSPYAAGATLEVSVVRPFDFPPEVIMTDVSLDASGSWRPRAQATDSDGGVIAGSVAGISLAMEGLTFKVTNGGDGKTGRFLIIYRRQ